MPTEFDAPHAQESIDKTLWPDALACTELQQAIELARFDPERCVNDEHRFELRIIELLTNAGLQGLYAVWMLSTLKQALWGDPRAVGVRLALLFDVVLPLLRMLERRHLEIPQPLQRAGLSRARHRIIDSSTWRDYASEWKDGCFDEPLERLAGLTA